MMWRCAGILWPPTLSVERDEPGHVEEQDDTDVGATGAEGLQMSFSEGQTHDLRISM